MKLLQISPLVPLQTLSLEQLSELLLKMHGNKKDTKKKEKKKRTILKMEVVERVKKLHELVCESIQLYEMKKKVLTENEAGIIITNLTMIHQLYSKDNIKNLTAVALDQYITKASGYVDLITQRYNEYTERENRIKVIKDEYKEIQLLESDKEIIGLESYSSYDVRCKKLEMEMDRASSTVEHIEEEYNELEKLYNHYQDIINEYKSKTDVVEQLKKTLYLLFIYL